MNNARSYDASPRQHRRRQQVEVEIARKPFSSSTFYDRVLPCHRITLSLDYTTVLGIEASGKKCANTFIVRYESDKPKTATKGIKKRTREVQKGALRVITFDIIEEFCKLRAFRPTNYQRSRWVRGVCECKSTPLVTRASADECDERVGKSTLKEWIWMRVVEKCMRTRMNTEGQRCYVKGSPRGKRRAELKDVLGVDVRGTGLERR